MFWRIIIISVIHECVNCWVYTSLLPILPYYRSNLLVSYSVSLSYCWFVLAKLHSVYRIWLERHRSTDRGIDGEITNISPSKCLTQSLLWQVGFHCSLFMFLSQLRKRVLFLEGMNAYSIQLADPFTQLYATQYTILHV